MSEAVLLWQDCAILFNKNFISCESIFCGIATCAVLSNVHIGVNFSFYIIFVGFLFLPHDRMCKCNHGITFGFHQFMYIFLVRAKRLRVWNVCYEYFLRLLILLIDCRGESPHCRVCGVPIIFTDQDFMSLFLLWPCSSPVATSAGNS